MAASFSHHFNFVIKYCEVLFYNEFNFFHVKLFKLNVNLDVEVIGGNISDL